MVYGLTIFVSAFLLFLVQLVIGKRILPWFGGAPAVWTTCMLFFQLLLLSGYAYAHFLTSRFSTSVQARIHGVLLLGSGLLLILLWWNWGAPILPGENWKPVSPEGPVWQILKLLSVSVGIPFFILSSTAPLLQSWYSRRGANEGTYRLYALSNGGSMLALLSYPFVIEPIAGLFVQGNGWGILYFIFVAGCIACGSRVSKMPGVGTADVRCAEKRPGWSTIALWLFLAACSSAMLLAVTNSVCQEVAVVPFLWIVPLAIYLLTFILSFDSPKRYNRRWFILAGAASSLLVLMTALRGIQVGIITSIFSYGVFLFLFCMICHGELVRLRPTTHYLTLFYLMVALGGVIGGIFIGVVAPLFFKGYWEFHLVLLAGWILLAIVLTRDKSSAFFRGDRLHMYLVLLPLGYWVVQLMTLLISPDLLFSSYFIPGSLVLAVIAVAFVALFSWKSKIVQSKYWPRILVGIVIVIAGYHLANRLRSGRTTTVAMDRNFFGVTTVSRLGVIDAPSGQMLELMHGQISHGIQFLSQEWNNQPVGYYAKASGVGLAFRHHPRSSLTNAPAQPMNVGLLGLGVGTLASFAREGDVFRFYEINPTIVSYSAGDKPLFTYLQHSAGTVQLVMGDARLSLERELQSPNQFDILVMDVFSSDSVPAHLLTSEAFEIYLRHLRDEDSIVAVHISNLFLQLDDLVASTAHQFGLKMVLIDGRAESPDATASRWCLLTRGKKFLENPEIKQLNIATPPVQNVVWSDDYSNLLRLLR